MAGWSESCLKNSSFFRRVSEDTEVKRKNNGVVDYAAPSRREAKLER